jgi:hypothetical protein
VFSAASTGSASVLKFAATGGFDKLSYGNGSRNPVAELVEAAEGSRLVILPHKHIGDKAKSPLCVSYVFYVLFGSKFRGDHFR